jgi:hypothetical protein
MISSCRFSVRSEFGCSAHEVVNAFSEWYGQFLPQDSTVSRKNFRHTKLQRRLQGGERDDGEDG